MFKKALILIAFIAFFSLTFAWTQKPSWRLVGNQWHWDQTNAQFYIKDTAFGNETRMPDTITCFDSLYLPQWIDWFTEATKAKWNIIRPGTYAGMGPVVTLNSNASVTVTVSGLLRYHDSIPRYFGLTTATANHPDSVTTWYEEDSCNGSQTFEPDDLPLSARIWSKVVIDEDAQGGEYSDDVTVEIDLVSYNKWIEPSVLVSKKF